MFESIHVLCTLPEVVLITRTQTHVTSICHFTTYGHDKMAARSGLDTKCACK